MPDTWNAGLDAEIAGRYITSTRSQNSAYRHAYSILDFLIKDLLLGI